MKDLPLSSLGMQDSVWKLYKIDDPYIHEKTVEIVKMKRRCFETMYHGKLVTLGVYEYNNKEVLKAWGYKDEEHCSYHAIKTNSTWSDVIEGCPDFKVLKEGFSLSYIKTHIWESDTYREEIVSKKADITNVAVCSLTEKAQPSLYKTYLPLIVTALSSFVIGCIITIVFKDINFSAFIMNGMGVFITTIGILKLKNVARFVSMFSQYDPLAKRWHTYAKVYPYLETALGLLILFNLFIAVTQIAVIFIYTCTTIGIIHSLAKEKKLQCGCLGGGIQLPLSKVTIFENLAMVLMALLTLTMM